MLWQKVSPRGEWTCEQNFSSNSFNILPGVLGGKDCLSKVSPADRVISSNNGPLLVLADPVYFSVFTPRAFSRAEVSITYRPHLSSATPIIEAGFLADNKLWRYDLKPVYNLWLEQDLVNWSSLSIDNLHLFQREKKFDSIFDFLDAWQNNTSTVCSSPNCLAVYNFDLKDFPPAINLDLLNKNTKSLIFPYTLRGSHQFYFYLSGEDLNLSGELLDRNEGKDRDDAELSIYYGQKNIASLLVKDDGVEIEGSGDDGPAKFFTINRDNLKPGLYRLDFRASDDLMINNLNINSQYFSALHKVWLEDDGPIDLVTDASYLQVKAFNPAALQTLTFNQAALEIEEIYTQYEIRGGEQGDSWYNIHLNRGGVILENNGVFALEGEFILNPNYPRLDRSTDLTTSLDYILADYELAQALPDNWLQSNLDFSTANFYREKGNYNLILSIPGLKSDQAASGYLEIKEIKIRFYGNSLWFKIKNWLNL
ncbi:MAG: hypothetical protein PHE20_00245 [Patescibacteria group bacterium]|nr:hypothetical protein [Patescibacteria group bacterium]